MRWYQTLGFKTSMWLSLIALPLLGLSAWRIVTGEAVAIEELTIQKGKTAAIAGARAYGVILELGVDSGELLLADLLRPVYQEIQFTGMTVEGTRYHTQFDHYTDTHGIQAIEDAIMTSSPDLMYGVGTDIGAYVPTTHAAYSSPPTGDVAHDRKVSRSKRKFELPMQLTAANYLGTEPLVQPYDRDTGDKAWDVSVPIWVKGKHFGCFRVGVRRDRIDAHKVAFIMELGGIFAVLSACLVLFIFVTLTRAMRPLSRLATAADRLGVGDDLDAAITSGRRDEVGRMANSLNHVRLGLRAAVRRIERDTTASYPAVNP
jgi:HAMP domain-containing protein